jgi:all-trans-retinol 13,14-reductase
LIEDKKYKRFSPKEDYSGFDYLVIGSGIGGLSTAILLSKAGKKVLVLEKHYVPGGFSHTFKRKDGFVWDVGVHYVGNMDKETSFLRKISNYLTNDKLDWEYMGDAYDQVHIGPDEYTFYAGKEKLREQLYAHFPQEKTAIDTYLVLIGKASKYSALFFMQKTFPWFLRITVGTIFKRLFNKFALKTTYEVLRGITDNEKLISVLCAQCGNYGLAPRKSSFAIHATVINHFIDGGYYPVGGADQIYKRMIDVFYENGGELLVKANVEDIVVEKDQVKGVVADGIFIPCKNVISNAGARNTFENLLGKSLGDKWSKKLKNVKPSTSHLCLYIGLDRSDEELHLPKHNVWVYDNYDFDATIELNINNPDSPLKFAYISFPSAKDPSWKLNKPGTATMQAIGVANYEWFKKYEDQPWMNRGDEYEKMKEQFKEKMLTKLYELFPAIKGHVICTEVSTPLSTKHFTNYSKGEIYGLEHSPERFQLNSLNPKTSIKGLYLAGQDVVTVGIAGAIASGLLCAIAILKFKITGQFKKMMAPDKVKAG